MVSAANGVSRTKKLPTAMTMGACLGAAQSVGGNTRIEQRSLGRPAPLTHADEHGRIMACTHDGVVNGAAHELNVFVEAAFGDSTVGLKDGYVPRINRKYDLAVHAANDGTHPAPNIALWIGHRNAFRYLLPLESVGSPTRWRPTQ